MKARDRRIVTAAVDVLPRFLRDGVGLAAVASISYGSWLAWEPAGYIVGGSLVLIGVLLWARNDHPLPDNAED